MLPNPQWKSAEAGGPYKGIGENESTTADVFTVYEIHYCNLMPLLKW